MTVELSGSSAAMECADLDRALDPYLDGELDPADRADADAHVAACDRCRQLVEERARLRSAMRRCLREAMGGGATAGRAPSSLRRRIVEALGREPRPARWARRLLPISIAAVAAAWLVASALLRDGDRLADEAVRRHARDLPLEVTAAAGDDHVASWFDGKLDFNPRPPRFGAADLRVVGARLSHIGDLPAAYIRYELPRGRLGLFIVEDPERRLGASGRAVRVGADDVHLAAARGYNLATWRRDGVVYSLVGDVGEEQLTAIVRSASPPQR